MTPSSPRQKTIKRIFAVSGNKCYFPNCNTPLVDKGIGTVIGEICHIKGKKSESTRYDPYQSDEERHGFDNLVLMCPLHHKVIDDDSDSYTVSRLKEIKVEHEKIHAGGMEPSDEIVNQFILNHTNQQKWQEFYNRMANTDPKHLGIDVQYLLNNKINESDFEEVLKMNVGANHKYLKIYSNEEWYFSLINRRMGGNYYEIIVRNENTQQIYDFFNPSVNGIILKEWLDYIAKYCAIAGKKIKKLWISEIKEDSY